MPPTFSSRTFASSLIASGRITVLGALLLFTGPLNAQAPSTAEARKFLSNGGFESGFRRGNLWDGVDSSGFLAGERAALPILTQGGTIGETAMPLSVSIADLNADGLPDIVAMDSLGYLRVYFNSGTKTEPKFTKGEMANVFLSRINWADPTLQGLSQPHIRQGQRIHLHDMAGSGKEDLIVGNYIGEILFIPNAGSPLKPDFRQPANIASALIPTMKNSMSKWGNLFAPAVWDWNRDGKDDLLLGEGSYSANNIHLLINQGSSAKPVFDENNRSVLAYGMGLEQLTPCVVDYNGDGKPDLLVAERSGKVAVYLNSGAAWKPGETLGFTSFISASGAGPSAEPSAQEPLTAATAPGLLSVGGICTIAADDLNGDGLFDLVFGKSNGKIAICLNAGTKTEPKFSAPVEAKGQEGTPAFSAPSGWEYDFGLDRGNFYGFLSVVKGSDDPEAKPPEGEACLKAGYTLSPNKIMPVPTQYSPAFERGWVPLSGGQIKSREAPANFFNLVQGGRAPLKVGKTYILSMKVKGSKVSNGFLHIGYSGSKTLSESKITRGERGSATVQTNVASERKEDIGPFNATPQWTEVRKEFTMKFADKNLADLTEVADWSVAIVFTLAPGSGVLYIDDVKITER